MTDDLLVKYLLGEATSEEAAHVQQWIAADAANKKQFDHFSLIWNESKKLSVNSTIDENAAWLRFQQRVAQQDSHKAKTVSFRPMQWIRVAAILILMIGIGWATYYTIDSGRMIALHSDNNILTQTLPDGSVVTLNKNSTIKYPKHFKGNTRDVELDGEAFFNVAPDKSKPFYITVDEVTVKVVGTSFNVKSNHTKTEVVVETGIVEVSKNNKGVVLNPKEKATVRRNADAPVKEQSTDELYNYYRTKEFVCNATPLWRLADVLSEVYNVKIEIANAQLYNLPLTTTFHNESLDSILQVISETFNIQVEKTGDRIILK